MAPQSAAPNWDDLVPLAPDQASGVPKWDELVPVASHEPAKKSFLDQKAEQYGQPVAPPNKPKSIGVQLLEPFDPKTTRGRINLAGTLAGGLTTALTGGLSAPGFAAWMTRVFGPPVAAAAAGAATAQAEKTLGTAPPDTSAAREALIQGGTELGGQVPGWLLRRGARGLLATQVGKQAKVALDELAETVKSAGTRAVESARAAKDALLTTARGRRDAVVAGTREAVGSSVREAEGLATRLTEATAKKQATDLAAIELRNAEELADATAHYQRVLADPPSTLGAASAARDVVAGAPGVRARGPKGPAIRALDAAGKDVVDAAAKAPPISIVPVKQAADEMFASVTPAGFGAPPPQKGMGFLQNLRAARAQPGLAAANADPTRLNKQIADALGIQESALHPDLPGVLGELANAGDTVSFADAHRWKKVLDEAVNFDRAAKKRLEQVTKGVRTVLRAQMDDPAYNKAAQVYADLIPLYRKGIGRDLIQAFVNEKPDRIARLLDEQSPASAQALHDLLVKQSASGGDVAAGRKAWDAIVNSYIYDNVVKGGADGLQARLVSLMQNPEFARVAFQYPEARATLSNLYQIGGAVADATAKGAERVSGAKATGAAAVGRAKAIGEAGIAETKQVGEAAMTQARRQGAQDILNARREGSARVTSASQDASNAVERVAQAQARMRASTVNPDALATDEANALRALLGRNAFRAIGVLRLLSAAKTGDIVEWAAYSTPRTQALVRVLLGNESDRAAAFLLRELGGVVNPMQPMPSHEPTTAAR